MFWSGKFALEAQIGFRITLNTIRKHNIDGKKKGMNSGDKKEMNPLTKDLPSRMNHFVYIWMFSKNNTFGVAMALFDVIFTALGITFHGSSQMKP